MNLCVNHHTLEIEVSQMIVERHVDLAGRGVGGWGVVGGVGGGGGGVLTKGWRKAVVTHSFSCLFQMSCSISLFLISLARS